MPTLESILPAANLTLPDNNETPASAGAFNRQGEPFDALMTRALSPDPAGAGTRRSPSGSGGKQNSSAVHPPRRRAQAPDNANEPAAPADAKTPDAPARLADKSSVAPASESESAADSDPANGAGAVSGNLPAAILQFVTALPASGFSLLMGAAQPAYGPAAEANPTASVPSVADTITEAGTAATLAAQSETPPAASAVASAIKPDGSPNQTDAGPARRVKPDGKQSLAAQLKGIAPGKSGSDDLKTSAAAVNDLKDSELPIAGPISSKTAAEPAVSLPSPEAATAGDLSAETLTLGGSESHGTAAAKLYISMNKTEKVNKVAGSTEKVLPVTTDSTAQENNLPTNDRPTPISPRNGQAVIIIGPPTKGPEGVEVPAAAVGISATAALDLRARAFERAHDMVALHALRLVDSQSDTLHVVIKPGAGMQLSLELRQRGDAVDAQVVLQRGDFDALSQHWPELQQRLEQRGIRLAPLTGSENSATDASGQGFQKQQQGFENPDPISAGAFAEFALAQSNLHPSIPPSALAVNRRGWETWA